MTENINFELRKYSKYYNYEIIIEGSSIDYTFQDYAIDLIDRIKRSIKNALETWDKGRLNVYNFSHPMGITLEILGELKKYIDYLNGGICLTEKIENENNKKIKEIKEDIEKMSKKYKPKEMLNEKNE